jgi:hypothetical protein
MFVNHRQAVKLPKSSIFFGWCWRLAQAGPAGIKKQDGPVSAPALQKGAEAPI